MQQVYWETQDIQQEFDVSVWLSLQKGHTIKQAYARAKFQTIDFKRKQLKEHFRQWCDVCGRDYWIGVYQCTNCGSGEFTHYPTQDYPLHDPGVSRYDDPAAVALSRIEMEQFRKFIKPHCSGKYDWYIFEALIDGQSLHQIAETFGLDDSHMGFRFRRLKKLYKYFSEGKEFHHVNKTQKISKETFVYRKGKTPSVIPTWFLVRGGNPDDYHKSDGVIPEILLEEE